MSSFLYFFLSRLEPQNDEIKQRLMRFALVDSLAGIGAIFRRCCRENGIQAAGRLMLSCWTDARIDLEPSQRYFLYARFLEARGYNAAAARTRRSRNVIIQSLQNLAFCCRGPLPTRHSARPPERISPPMGTDGHKPVPTPHLARDGTCGKRQEGDPPRICEGR